MKNHDFFKTWVHFSQFSMNNKRLCITPRINVHNHYINIMGGVSMNNAVADFKNKQNKLYQLKNNSFVKKIIEAFEENKDTNKPNLQKAKEDWENAQIYFNNVTDPELIDYAIYNMEAAKIKYFYLLKKMRAEYA